MASNIREENRWINERKRLLRYQISFFEKELRKEEQRLANLIAGQERRKKSYGLKYESREEVEQAYVTGIIDKDEMYAQYRALWNTYSDRGANMRIAWLKEELEVYQKQQEEFNALIEQKRQEGIKRHNSKKRKKYMREYMREYSKKRRNKE